MGWREKVPWSDELSILVNNCEGFDGFDSPKAVKCRPVKKEWGHEHSASTSGSV